MAVPVKRGNAALRKREPLLVILALVLIVAGATFFYFRNATPGPETAAPTAAVQPEVPATQTLPRNHIYSETVDPWEDIAGGIKQAKLEHKRVILDFGGDWCGDCQVLDLYFHQAPNSGLLAQNFILVHVFIGEHIDKNLDLGIRYNVPLKKGVPALAVLDAQGNLLYSQTGGEFENMRRMDAASVTEFLNRWKA